MESKEHTKLTVGPKFHGPDRRNGEKVIMVSTKILRSSFEHGEVVFSKVDILRTPEAESVKFAGLPIGFMLDFVAIK